MRKFGNGVVHGGTFTAIPSRSPPPRRRWRSWPRRRRSQTIAEYGTKLRAGMSQILSQRGIKHSFSGHPSMSGLFFSEKPPRDYRDWATQRLHFLRSAGARTCTTSASSASRTRASPGSSARRTTTRCLAETLAALRDRGGPRRRAQGTDAAQPRNATG